MSEFCSFLLKFRLENAPCSARIEAASGLPSPLLAHDAMSATMTGCIRVLSKTAFGPGGAEPIEVSTLSIPIWPT